jgi:hypothetical protein
MSSQSENIETEAQKQADIQKLTAVFVVIVAFFQNIFNAFNNSSRVTAIFTLFAIIIILTLMILSYMYIRQLLIDYSVSKLISNPLNLEAPDYVISKSTQFLGSKYKYQLFIILPIISFICCLIALLYPNTLYKVFRVQQIPAKTQGLVLGIIIACLLQSLIAIIVNISTYSYAYKSLNLVNSRIKNLNNFIHNKIYKNANFLGQMKEIPSNSLLVMKVIKAALFNIENEPTVDSLANAFFTLNLYFHFHKIGFRNPNITDAMKIFDIHYLFKGSSFKDKIVNVTNLITENPWSPTDFLFRSTTFIEDYSVAIKRMYMAIPNNNTSVKSVDLAISKVAVWLEELNNRANTLTPEDSWRRFLPMAITILIIQCVPLLILMYIFQKERVREAFIGFIKQMFPKQTTTATNIPST